MGILDKLRKKPEDELPLKNLERSLTAEEEEEEEEQKAEKERNTSGRTGKF